MNTLNRIGFAKPVGRLLAASAGALLLIGAAVAPALAAEIDQGDTVVIGPGQVVDDDLYAFGSNVQVLGVVNGDVFAAGSSVAVTGTVNGSVYAAGSSVDIAGTVKHGVHAAGNSVSISGPVGEDATVAAGTLTVNSGSGIGRDLLTAGGTVALAAPVGRDVRANVGTLTVAEGANIGRSLTYTSDRDVVLAPGVTVGGGIEHLQPQTRQQPAAPVLGFVDWLRGLVGLAAIGLVFALVLPGFSAKTIETARGAYWQSLGAGLALFIGVPIVALVVFIVGLLIGGWILAFALLALEAIACAVGASFAAMFTGNRLLALFRQPPQHLAWNLVEGLLVLGVIGLLPFLGGVVLFVAMVFGLGAFALRLVASYRAARHPAASVAPLPASEQPQLAAA